MLNITKETIRLANDFIYTHAGYSFGEDQAYIDYPVRFPTVTFYLEDTHELNMMADVIRKSEGYLPMFDDSGEYDDDGWYNFSVGINTFTKYHVDTAIEFVVCNGSQADDEQTYLIELDETEQETLWKVLDEECMEAYGVGCNELLKEAKAEIERE